MRRDNVPPGTRFGKLTVIREVEERRLPSGARVRQFLCRCDCGTSVIVLYNNLKHGRTRSCGCLSATKVYEEFMRIGIDLNTYAYSPERYESEI